MDAATVTGIVLLLVLPLIVADGVGGVRAGYNSAFWRQPLESKLDFIAEHPRGWTRLGIVWFPLLVLSCAGMSAFTIQLSDAGAGTAAFLALGAYLLGSFAWLVGALFQTTVVRRAVEVRADTGKTPDWLEAFWQAGWWCELTYILAANAAFIVWGVGILQSGFPADWAGWTMIVLGGATTAGVAATREGFPQLGVLAPVILGAALLLT